MKVDLYSATGDKKGSLELPAVMFEAPINRGLMHLALVRQHSNARRAVAHAKSRGEVRGSTRKLFQQKGTGNARRGSVRSPLLKGGGKAFGPKSRANYVKDMPQKMRRAALFSCLSLRAKDGIIVGLESYPDEVKTKTFASLCKKMALPVGRKIIVVHPGEHRGLSLSARNVKGMKTLPAAYLNPRDILEAYKIVFLADAVEAAEKVFALSDETRAKRHETDSSPKARVSKPAHAKKPKATKKDSPSA